MRCIGHAGAELRAHWERDGACVVRYAIDGHEHTSTLDPADLTIASAGVCLSGQDEQFDLASLVGVLRQGRARDELYYWD